MTFFTAIIEACDEGGFSVEVVGTGVNGQGETRTDALTDAALILQEVIDDAIRDGEALPAPGEPSAEERARGDIALLPATLPAQAA